MSYTNEEMLESLRKLLRIPSVSGHGANPGQPYGKEVDEALDHTLALCRSGNAYNEAAGQDRLGGNRTGYGNDCCGPAFGCCSGGRWLDCGAL